MLAFALAGCSGGDGGEAGYEHRADDENAESPAEAAATAVRFTELKDKMCRCAEGDVECAKRVTDELTRWSEEKARMHLRVITPDPDGKLGAISRQLSECIEKAMMPKMGSADR